jgi:4-hydroxybenzoate polyprenyltransferase
VQSISKRSLAGFIKATHFGPTILVATMSFFLSLSPYSVGGALQIAVAVLAGQCVVGWTNELIDLPLDIAASREKKPLVTGEITAAQLRPAVFIALFLALVLSLLAPWGILGTLLHALALLSATLYNFRFKKTVLSVLPYVISFGALLWAIYLGAEKHPPFWLFIAFISFTSAFHFLNVLKDLEMDIPQGVHGLPQRLGKNLSIASAAILATVGIAFTVMR